MDRRPDRAGYVRNTQGRMRFVSGHGFSRTAKCRYELALAPEILNRESATEACSTVEERRFSAAIDSK
jgi:hypothetical protein